MGDWTLGPTLIEVERGRWVGSAPGPVFAGSPEPASLGVPAAIGVSSVTSFCEVLSGPPATWGRFLSAMPGDWLCL